MLKRIPSIVFVLFNLLISDYAFASPPLEQMRKQTVRVLCILDINTMSGGMGSGFVVGDSDHIVTNWHVVSNENKACPYLVVLNENEKIQATLLHAESEKDIAILKLPKKLSIKPVEFSSDARIGDEIIANGFPGSADEMGPEHVSNDNDFVNCTTTFGKIGKVITPNEIGKTGFYQVDAAINRGNSGGPLFNRFGQVIGINTLKAYKSTPVITLNKDQSGKNLVPKIETVETVSDGIAWAIQTKYLLPILDQLNISYVNYDHTHWLLQLWEDQPFLLIMGIVVILLVGGVIYLIFQPKQVRVLVEKFSSRHRPIPNPSAKIVRVPVLRGITGPNVNMEIPLSSRSITIGRNPDDCNLVIPDKWNLISRKHVTVEFEKSDNVFKLCDKGSMHGTYKEKGSKRLLPYKETILEAGESFYLGDRKVMYQVFFKNN